MYELIFKNADGVEIKGKQSILRIRTARWMGDNPPKYLCLILKKKHLSVDKLKMLENNFWYDTLEEVKIYDIDTGDLNTIMKVPTPFLELQHGDGELVVCYGDTLYADDAY